MILALFLAAAVSEPPIDCANAMTQTDMNVCSYRDFLAADRSLNELWNKVTVKVKNLDGLGPKREFQRHLDAQRKWLAYRDAQCLAENGPREESGTIWPLLQNTCLKKLTDARAQLLHAYLETGD